MATPRPPEPTAGSVPPPTAAQLRDDINSGRSGDKVAGFDPAAASMETDAEAGGTPPSASEIAQARAHENRGAVSGRRANASEPDMTPDGVVNRRPSALLWAVGLGALGLVAVVVAFSAG